MKTSKLASIALLLAVPLVLLVLRFATGFMALATIAYTLLVLGWIFRKNRTPHVVLMLSGILMDLAIVLTLQFQRSAIQTAVSFTLDPLQQAHIAFSSAATALYVPTLVLGFVLLRRGRKHRGVVRQWHVRLASLALILRSLGFLLMFSLLFKESGH